MPDLPPAIPVGPCVVRQYGLIPQGSRWVALSAFRGLALFRPTLVRACLYPGADTACWLLLALRPESHGFRRWSVVGARCSRHPVICADPRQLLVGLIPLGWGPREAHSLRCL